MHDEVFRSCDGQQCSDDRQMDCLRIALCCRFADELNHLGHNQPEAYCNLC